MAVFEEQVVPLGGARVERHARALGQHCRGQEDFVGPTLCVKKAHKKNLSKARPPGRRHGVTSDAASPNSALITYGISLVDQLLLTAILVSCNTKVNNFLLVLNVYVHLSCKT